MTFFLIVPSVVVVSIILVYSVTNYVGLKIKYGALFMCAVLTFLSLFVAMEISPNPDKNFFIKLGVMILLSSTIITAFNRFLILREKKLEQDFTEEVRRAYSKSLEEKNSSSEVAKDRLKKVSDQNTAFSTQDITTLDELIVYAKSELEQGNVTSAVNAYQRALDEYPEDDYAPFVAIDLSAIYREQAAYTKAIKVYEEALNLPAVKKNHAVEDEFQKKLAYIKIAQEVLFRHRILSTPFSEIPKEYFLEIERRFKENFMLQKKANS